MKTHLVLLGLGGSVVVTLGGQDCESTINFRKSGWKSLPGPERERCCLPDQESRRHPAQAVLLVNRQSTELARKRYLVRHDSRDLVRTCGGVVSW